MKPTSWSKIYGPVWIAVSAVVALAGCGSHSSNQGTSTPPPPPQVAISPATAAVLPSQTQQFKAIIAGTSTGTVTWSVDQIAGGNSTVGTITTAGLYTAPAAVGTHTITASVSSPTTSATAAVTIFTVSISAASATVAPSGSDPFTATAQGISNASVNWAVDGVAGGNSSTGTISASGLYTAPATLGSHTIAATSALDASASVSASVTVINVSQNAVLTYHNDDARDGAYLEETTLTPANVNSNQFGKLLSYPVDGQIYGQPLYLPQVSLPNNGRHDVVYVATQNNSVYAFDADATAAQPTTFWHVNFGPPYTTGDEYGVFPVAGVVSTPVIDATTNTIYLVSEVSGNSPPFFLHALDATTGADLAGSPVHITASFSGDSLESGCYQRMGVALNPVTNWVYLAFGSCTHGWVLAYDKTTLAQEGVMDDTPGASGGGLWSSGGAPAIDDTTGDLYLMSGTDAGDQQWITGSTQVGYNDSFLRLDPNTLNVLDSFSPDDNYYLAENDADLGSGGNILVPGSALYPHETLGGGKDGNIYVVNRDNMGGFNDSTNNVIQDVFTGNVGYTDSTFSTPVYWNGFIYYHNNRDYLRAYTWNARASAGQQMSSPSVAQGPDWFQMHGATASLSANGTTNGIVWDIDNTNYNSANPSQSGACVLHAYEATNIANELYNSTQAGSRDSAGPALKFTVPTIANGKVFVPTGSELDIYGLLP